MAFTTFNWTNKSVVLTVFSSTYPFDIVIVYALAFRFAYHFGYRYKNIYYLIISGSTNTIVSYVDKFFDDNKKQH